ncbi:uncharacterized protein LOC144649024 isoform X2 [Oculina patagonica]
MSSDQKMAPNDKKDTRFRDSRKGSPDRWGKPGRRDSTPPKETNRDDPHSLRCRVFIGNLQMSRKELEDIFSQYGKVVGCSVHNNYGFVQFEDEKSADDAVAKENGKFYNGKRVDVNLAGDRRKEKMDDRPRDRDSRPPFPFNRRERDFDRDGNRPFRKSPPRERPRFEDYDRFPSRFEPPFDRRGRSPSPPRRMEDRPYGRNDDYYMRERYRDEPPHREPYPRHFEHRGEPFDRDRRDPYDSPRGPYPERRDERYDRYDSYGREGRDGRDYPRPDEYPGPAKRPRMGYDGPDETYSSSKSIEAPTDCVIVVMNKQQRGYAEMVQRRLKSVGLVVELHFHGTQPIMELLDDVARRGVLYAIVITSQHEVHRSVTVNILHGTPQEHRNMPLDDAMRLVGQNFDQYMQDLRERAKGSSTQDSSKDTTAAVPKDEKTNDITALLSKAATGASLSADQLTKLIDNLSKRQEEVLGSSTSANGKGGITTSQPSQPAVDPQSIAKQQADLQAKILSILNPGGGAKPAGTPSTSSMLSQQAKNLVGVAAPAGQTPAKPAALSTTGKPIFPLYPVQQKPAATTAAGGYMAAPAIARVPAGAAAARPLSSTLASQPGKAYQSASPYGSTPATVAGKQGTSYQFTKPGAPGVQSTYTVGSNQAGAAASSSSVYGSQVAQPSQNYAARTQAQSGKFGHPQQTAATTVARSPIPVVSKFSPAGQAIGTVGAPRPAVNSAPNVGRGAPTSVSGPRPVSSIAGGQVRTPSPGLARGRAGLLGASPTSGIGARALAPGAVRTPSPSGVRMGAPRGPSPVGRGTVRTPSPAGIPRGAVPVRGAAISVRGGGSGATRPPLTQAGTGLGTATPQTRGALAQRGAPATRGIPTRGGPPVPARGTPTSRGAPAPRGAQAPRGAPLQRGAPYMRGAPNNRGAPIRPVTRGGPSGQGGPMNRGAPRGRSMVRGGPPFRGGRGNPGGYGGY